MTMTIKIDIKRVKLKSIFLLYLKYYLILDLVMGFLLKYKKYSFLINPGQIIRGLLLLILIAVFFYDIQKKIDYTGKYFISIISFAIIFLIIFYFRVGSIQLLFSEVAYFNKILFILLLLYYVIKHHEFFSKNLDSIILCNFTIFSSSILFGYFFNVGLSTYSYIEKTSKGMFYGGNTVSVLSLVFLIYFFFNLKFKIKNILPILISLLNMHIISTKAIFLTPFIATIYFINTIKDKNLFKKISFISILIPIIFFSFHILNPIAVDLYNNRYGKVIQRSYRFYQKNERVFNSPVTAPFEMIAYRRAMAVKQQTSFLFEKPIFLLIGLGHCGQVSFWKENEATYLDASMDFFDILFMYGAIGAIIIFMVFLKTIFYLFFKIKTDRNSLILIIVFLYSFFGGHVINANTSGTMLALFAAINYAKYHDTKWFNKCFQWLKN